ncbi:unnamed protein product [Closterium sp. Naga37s-1]|nr:unnamed protein product [Closterium sp. Naga37s-1]
MSVTRRIIHSNQLTGTLPSSLGNLPALIRLLCFFCSPLCLLLLPSPPSPSLRPPFNTVQRSVWQPVDRDDPELPWKVDEPSVSLTGTLPSSLGNCSYLLELDVGGNNISGTIPSFLGNLRELTTL